MRRILLASTALIALGSAGSANMLQAIIADTHQSGAAFTGIGDVKSGAKLHYGTVAYSAATRGANMLNLCNVADVACADVASNATTGLVSSTQVIGGVTCGTTVGVNVCTVKTAYDDSGGSNCGGVCNVTQATILNRPTFIPSASGSVPAIKCVSGNAQRLVGSGFTTIAEPHSMVGSFSEPGAQATNSRVLATTSSILGASAASKAFYFHGTILSIAGTLTNNIFYAIVGTTDGSGNGTIAINGTTTTGAVGTGSTGTGFAFCSDAAGGNVFNGQVIELGLYPSTISAGEITSLTSTMRANGGGF